MNRYKYPRTYHMPWSEALQNDDRVIQSHRFDGQQVVITEKMDGENTSVYFRDQYIHARSIDTDGNHESRKKVWSMLKASAAALYHSVSYLDDMRVVGENCYAKHSIHYEDLDSYFYVFGMYLDNLCASWFKIEELAEQLGFPTVPVLYQGEWDEDTSKNIFETVVDNGGEGIVIRTVNGFMHTSDPTDVCIAKAVRKGHVQPNDKHWMTAEVIPNKLKK